MVECSVKWPLYLCCHTLPKFLGLWLADLSCVSTDYHMGECQALSELIPNELTGTRTHDLLCVKQMPYPKPSRFSHEKCRVWVHMFFYPSMHRMYKHNKHILHKIHTWKDTSVSEFSGGSLLVSVSGSSKFLCNLLIVRAMISVWQNNYCMLWCVKVNNVSCRVDSLKKHIITCNNNIKLIAFIYIPVL